VVKYAVGVAVHRLSWKLSEGSAITEKDIVISETVVLNKQFQYYNTVFKRISILHCEA